MPRDSGNLNGTLAVDIWVQTARATASPSAIKTMFSGGFPRRSTPRALSSVGSIHSIPSSFPDEDDTEINIDDHRGLAGNASSLLVSDCPPSLIKPNSTSKTRRQKQGPKTTCSASNKPATPIASPPSPVDKRHPYNLRSTTRGSPLHQKGAEVYANRGQRRNLAR